MILGLAAVASIPLAAQAPRDLVLVLDASGSMWGQIEGRNKIVIAREVLGELLEGLPDTSDMGLVAYGHRREGDCADVEVLAPEGPVDKAALVERIGAINPKGKTPLAGSARVAVETVREHGGPVTVVLVTDGLETCDGDLCQTVREAREAGVDLRLHVVGFDLGGEEVSVLECAAEAGGGRYFRADDPEALAMALQQTTAEVAVPAGRLVVGAKADGELVDASVIARPAGGGEEVAIRTYASAETNPATLLLPDAAYDVEVRPVGMAAVPPVTFEGVAVREGEEARRDADFSTGELAVGVTRNGALSDASVKVIAAGGREVATGRTYRGADSNPRLFRLPPGRYEVVAKGLELADEPEHRWADVVVEPAGRAQVSTDLPSGELKVGAVSGSELVDATVRVLRLPGGENAGSGRTYVKPE